MSRFTDTIHARPNDLPPRWDGRQVRWGQWNNETICLCRVDDGSDGGSSVVALREHPCPSCGSTEPRVVCGGIIAPGAARNRDGFPAVGHGSRHLTAERCTACGHDYVTQGDEVWELDADDYTDRGSYP